MIIMLGKVKTLSGDIIMSLSLWNMPFTNFDTVWVVTLFLTVTLRSYSDKWLLSFPEHLITHASEAHGIASIRSTSEDLSISPSWTHHMLPFQITWYLTFPKHLIYHLSKATDISTLRNTWYLTLLEHMISHSFVASDISPEAPNSSLFKSICFFALLRHILLHPSEAADISPIRSTWHFTLPE